MLTRQTEYTLKEKDRVARVVVYEYEDLKYTHIHKWVETVKRGRGILATQPDVWDRRGIVLTPLGTFGSGVGPRGNP